MDKLIDTQRFKILIVEWKVKSFYKRFTETIKYRHRDCAVAINRYYARDQWSRKTNEAWWIGNEDEGAKVHHGQQGIRLSAVLDVDREKDRSFCLYLRGFRGLR